MINLDNNDANSDWIRSGYWDLPRTAESLLYKIGVDRWEHFKTLPSFKAIPEGLEAQVDELVRARKANNPDLVKYDEDQPRDELGRFGSGASVVDSGPNVGNGLTHKEILDLKRDQPDKLAKQLYKAEKEFRPQVQRELEMPTAPKSANFETREEYDRAYKDYVKDHTEWMRESIRDVISKTGEQHLNGTKSGLQKYVNEIASSDWFVERFGNGGKIGIPPVKLSNASYAGQYTIGTKNGEGYSSFNIDKGFTLNEPTIVHELAHYATAVSATEPHAGHGVEFAENYVFMTSQIFGEDYASGLKDAFAKEGVLNDK
jgi:hypothetical protein